MQTLTETQIRETVASLRMSEVERDALIRQALAGNASARFVIYAAWQKRERACANGR